MDIHAYATKIRNSWIGNHFDSTTTQKLATRAFKAVQRIAYGQAKRVRFKGKNQLKSVEGKSNKTGIRYIEATGHVEWMGLKLQCQIDVNDDVVIHGLSYPEFTNAKGLWLNIAELSSVYSMVKHGSLFN